MSQPLPGPWPPPNHGGRVRPAGTPSWFIAVTIVLGLGVVGVNLLFSLGMLFATDACGTGGPGGAAPVCTPGVWLAALALPWLGLVAGILVIVLGGIRRSRRTKSAQPTGPSGAFWAVLLLLGLAPYVVCCAVAFALVFG